MIIEVVLKMLHAFIMCICQNVKLFSTMKLLVFKYYKQFPDYTSSQIFVNYLYFLQLSRKVMPF